MTEVDAVRDGVEHICRIFLESRPTRQSKPLIWRVICQCGWTETFRGREAALYVVGYIHQGALTVTGLVLIINELP